MFKLNIPQTNLFHDEDRMQEAQKKMLYLIIQIQNIPHMDLFNCIFVKKK